MKNKMNDMITRKEVRMSAALVIELAVTDVSLGVSLVSCFVYVSNVEV